MCVCVCVCSKAPFEASNQKCVEMLLEKLLLDVLRKVAVVSVVQDGWDKAKTIGHSSFMFNNPPPKKPLTKEPQGFLYLS